MPNISGAGDEDNTALGASPARAVTEVGLLSVTDIDDLNVELLVT